MSDIIRTKRDGCWQVRSNSWGAFLQPADDPLAEADLEKGALERFELNDNIAPIPSELWSRWIKLCFHFVTQVRSEAEVSCRFLRHEDDKSQWRILIPAQDVGSAHVRVETFDEAIDIATGEIVDSYPPPGWIPCGSSHSHNTMHMARFSSTDDHFELGDPGLHIVISHIDAAKMTYVPTASITANHRRFYLPEAKAVVDLTPRPDCTFHPDVLKLIVTESACRPQWTPLLGARRSGFTHPNAGSGYSNWDDDDLLEEHSSIPAGIEPAVPQPVREGELWHDSTDDKLMLHMGSGNGQSQYRDPFVQVLELRAHQLVQTNDADTLNDLLWELSDLHAIFTDLLIDLER